MSNPISRRVSRGFLALAVFLTALVGIASAFRYSVSAATLGASFLGTAAVGVAIASAFWLRVDACAMRERLLGHERNTKAKGRASARTSPVMVLASVAGLASVFLFRALGVESVLVVAMAGGLGAGLCATLGIRALGVERDAQRLVDAGLVSDLDIPAPQPTALAQVWRTAKAWERALYVAFPALVAGLFVLLIVLEARRSAGP